MDPARIQSSDVLLFNEGQSDLPISLGNGMNIVVNLPWFSGHSTRQHLNSYGFLYYYKLPKLPDTAGEIRIRLTSSPDASTFNQGHDLKNPSGNVWNISLLRLASDAQLDPLCQKLVQDRLVTPSLIMHCKNLMLAGNCKFVLHALSQPFQIDFSQKFITLHLVGSDMVGRYLLRKIRNGLGQFKGAYATIPVQRLH